MKNQIIQRLDSLIDETKLLAEHLYTEIEFDDYSTAETNEEMSAVMILQNDRKRTKDLLLIKVTAFLNTHIPNKTTYLDILRSLSFQPKDAIYNAFHFKNDEAWRNDRTKLYSLLIHVRAEMFEEQFVTKPKVAIFNSGLFWTILSLACTLSFSLGTFVNIVKENNLSSELLLMKDKNNNLQEANITLRDSLKKVVTVRSTTSTKAGK